jgi:amino acid adenylation domain-containing protein
MNRRNIEAIYPLSPMQQGMLFHSLYAPQSGVYVEQMSCALRGRMNVPAFRRAWQRVIERHSILRTSFVWKNLDKLLQVVHRQVELPFEEHDLSHLSETAQQARIEAFLKEEISRGFDLSKAPLVRVAVLKISDEVWQFVLTSHHLLLDGWSGPLLFREVFAGYEAFAEGRELPLAPARPYRDYITWLQEQNPAEAETFWRQILQGFAAPTPLVVDHPATDSAEGNYQSVTILLSSELTTALQQLARKHQVTLNTVMQAAWALLLARYSGEDDIVFGATVSGRPADLPGVETMIGIFINTLPVRARINPDESILPLLKQLQFEQAGARLYEYCSLVQIQGWSEVPRTQPLFDSLFVFENYPLDSAQFTQTADLKISGFRFHEQTNYPLNFVISPSAELHLKLLYDPRRFDRATIERMMNHLRTLMAGIVANPEQKVSRLPLLTEAERHQIREWNQTATDYPREACLHQLFEAQAERAPEAVAIVCDDRQLTYCELNARADRLAQRLRRLGAGAGSFIGLFTERSPEMIVGILGVLKAGAAYLPLDPSYPKARLEFMLADTQAPVILTQSHLAARLPEHSARVICLDADEDQTMDASAEIQASETTALSPAMVIYTSGSTGQPKGVLIPHRGVARLVLNSNYLQADASDRFAQVSNISFDAATFEIWGALLHGARLVIITRDVMLAPREFAAQIKKHEVTIIFLTTALFALMVREEPSLFSSVRHVITGGEFMEPRWMREALAGHAPERLTHAYGPTENTTYTTCGLIDEVPADATNVPIGRPISNTQVYVLDRFRNPVPVGVPGELYTGGDGLALGYLNNPELTAEKFVEWNSEFGIRNSESSTAEFRLPPSALRLYRTGDLVKYRADGNIEFIGRIDQQVKIRGFRIEPGEVEAALASHPAIQESLCLADQDQAGNRRLVAYFVAPGETAPAISALRDYLGERLPDYMIPSAFVRLDHLPLTPNGKVDRRNLPRPEEVTEASQTVAPRTPVEELVANIWAAILGVRQVGSHDSFFELGGHSLLATQVVSRVRDAFGLELPLRVLFESPTVAEFARRIETEKLKGASRAEAPPIEPTSRDGHLPLSFAQQRLWFMEQFRPGVPMYNIAGGVRLNGQLNVAAIEQSLNEIIRRHENLRTSFQMADGEPVQIIAPHLTLEVPLTDLSTISESEREAELKRLMDEETQRPFDLTQAPLVRCRLFRLTEDEHIALLTLHHIISDGWSQGVLTHELGELYRAFAAGQASPLAELPIQYADYAQWQRAWFQGAELERQIAYWKEQLGHGGEPLDLPTDHPRQTTQTHRGAIASFTLSPELSDRIRALGQREGTTLFMTLLAAFQTLLHRYTGQADISVGAPIANRQRSEIEGLIGFFVNTLALRTEVTAEMNFRELLRRVRETALGAYAHQDLPFEQLVEHLGVARNLSHSPLFQVMFVLQNAPHQTIELEGLTLQPFDLENGTTQFDLTLMMAERDATLKGGLLYNTDLFEAATISRMIAHFEALLAAITANPEEKLANLPLMNEEERRQVLLDWNETAASYPDQNCFHQLFEAHAAARPEAIALSFEGRTLTYGELNSRANQLAHHLRQRGVTTETIVGVCAERSLDMIVGILGVMKADAAYLPLDPHYPADRLAFMFADSQSRLLLTQSHLKAAIPNLPSAIQMICLDAEWEQIAQESAENTDSSATPENLAYVIYTSGSTGQPKGAMLAHRGLCNLARAQQRAFNVSAGKRVLQFSPFSFDASVWEMAMALGNGATLVLARQERIALMDTLEELMRAERITHVTLPPSVLKVLSPALPELQVVVAAGEKCTAEIVARWSSGRRFFNAYGPTETTVCASMHECVADGSHPPIGRPLPNFKLFVLDRQQQPVPIGVPGELCVGGVAIARGYLNRPELTAEKFIAWNSAFGIRHSESPAAEFRLYRTGDQVRWLADGTLEYLGRVDEQMKIRGFRIEPGEIEAALREHPSVRDAVVTAWPDGSGERRLVAYLISQDNAAPSIIELKNHLRQRLPEYMVPMTFAQIEALPLGPSGKVDRRRLPAPESAQLRQERVYVAPRTETECEVAALWSELLNVEQISIEDNFFELGGHSLLATKMIARLRDTMNVELPLRSFFEAPTVAALAAQIETVRNTEPGELAQIAETLALMEQLSEEQIRALLEGETVSQP